MAQIQNASGHRSAGYREYMLLCMRTGQREAKLDIEATELASREGWHVPHGDTYLAVRRSNHDAGTAAQLDGSSSFTVLLRVSMCLFTALTLDK